MTLIHIVLVKVKPSVQSNGWEEFVKQCETLKDLPIAQERLKEHQWGPPVYDGRAQGFNWGLYSKFDSRADFEAYRDDELHKIFSKNVLLPNVDDIMAYDFEMP